MIPLVKPFLPPKNELMPALEEVLYSGYIAEGEKVYNFEDAFGSYVQNELCLSLNSGTAALHLALILAGVKEGDEVISTVLTAEPTNVAIKLVGAKVVWADIDSRTGLLDPASVREKINSKTKAIMLVHYAGMVNNVGEFQKIAAEWGIPIIEDAAHALGAKYGDKPIGSISDYTVFSLQAIKHMTTIDGGILCVKSESDYKRGRLLRWFGLDKTIPRLENDIQEPGYKYHMNNVNATLGLIQMKHLNKVVNSYISNGKFFDMNLLSVSGVQQLCYHEKTEPSYWLYTMKVKRRDDFIRKMESNGISASVLHLRNDRHSLFKESLVTLPVFEEFYSEMVHIPCGWWLAEEERDMIINVIKSGW
jgi:dTDP-4-amino-4,6-dideoxygalactose transaminase